MTPARYDMEAVATRLGVQVRHVRRLGSERRIPFIKWGRLLRFDPNEIEAWLDAARQPSTSEWALSSRGGALGLPCTRLSVAARATVGAAPGRRVDVDR